MVILLEGSPVSAAFCQISPLGLWPDGSHITARLEFAKIRWSDETKIKLFDLNAKCHIWKKSGTILTVKRGGSIMLWGCFSVPWTGRLVRIAREPAQDLCLGETVHLRTGQQH
uniref:Uncharacterized protein n=1 Tax=Oncorhynchus tshawytscha TaxID=74940 RepID=A0AAZ3S965_ONCTS